MVCAKRARYVEKGNGIIIIIAVRITKGKQ